MDFVYPFMVESYVVTRHRLALFLTKKAEINHYIYIT